MGFWIYMFIMVLLIPCSMIGFGKLFFKRPPKDINAVFGYRTNMSMKKILPTSTAVNYGTLVAFFYFQYQRQPCCALLAKALISLGLLGE